MSHSQFHCIIHLYLDMHGLIFETSVCYWQNQPGCYFFCTPRTFRERRPENIKTSLPHPPRSDQNWPRHMHFSRKAVLFIYKKPFANTELISMNSTKTSKTPGRRGKTPTIYPGALLDALCSFMPSHNILSTEDGDYSCYKCFPRENIIQKRKYRSICTDRD